MQKRLLMEGLVTVGGLVVAGAVIWVLSSFHDDLTQENLALQTQVASLNNEFSSLGNKYNKVQQNFNVYQEASLKQANDELAVNRDLIRKLLQSYTARFHLKNMSLNMARTQNVTESAYKRPTAAMAYSMVDISFDALSDEDVYALIDAIQREFSGKVKFYEMTLTRQSKLTKEHLLQIAESGHSKLVSASLKFIWFGINAESPEADKAGAANAP